MNSGAFGEGFPYTNFHDLNMDWIISIAKNFLDQYTHLQDLITNGETALTDLTDAGMDSLQNKATELENLLQTWYDTHSNYIATELTNAIQSLASELSTAITSFNNSADAKAQQTIATIPSDYTETSNKLNALANTVSAIGSTITVNGIKTPLVWLEAGDSIRINVTSNTVSSGFLNFSTSPYAEGDTVTQYALGETGIKTFTANKAGYVNTNQVTGAYTAVIEVITSYSTTSDAVSHMSNQMYAYNYGMSITNETQDFLYLEEGQSVLIWLKELNTPSFINFFVKAYAAGEPIAQFAGAGIQKYTAPKAGYLGYNTAFQGTFSGICYLLTHNPIILNIDADLTYPITLTDIEDVVIKGNGHKINLGTRLPYTANGELKYADYQYTPGDWIDKVFISQTHPLINTSSGIERTYYPNVPLWMTITGNYTTGIQLTPKATIIEVQNTPNSYTYDSQNSRFVVNCANNWHLWLGGSQDSAVLINNCRAHIESLVALFSRATNVDSYNSYIDAIGVESAYSLSNAGFKSSADYYAKYMSCKAYNNGRDGFSSNGTRFYYAKCCYSYGNHDDGISNHGDLNYGVVTESVLIEDSTFEGNRKAGIASPVYGTIGDIKNCKCSGNLLYGIEIETNTSYPVAQRIYVEENIINNSPIGIYNDKYTVTAIRNIFQNVTTNYVGTITIID